MCKEQEFPSLEEQIKKAEAKKMTPPENSSDTSDEGPYLDKFGDNKPMQKELER
ncbi:MAG: hypothetical protein IJ300_12865 [Clostridia bacterium]|nr:hypothetical protein [Clostridia bacterium]